MREISLHLLDIAQNSLEAGAGLIRLELLADPEADTLTVMVVDDGSGMSEEMRSHAADPFITSRSARRVGLGLSLLQAGTEGTGGSFTLESKLGEGTKVTAVYVLSHIDRPPIGDFAGTVHSLMVCSPLTDYRVTVQLPDQPEAQILDTREMRRLLGDVQLSEPEVSAWLRDRLCEMFPAVCADL